MYNQDQEVIMFQEMFEKEIVKKLAKSFIKNAKTQGAVKKEVKNIEAFFKTRFVRFCILLSYYSEDEGLKTNVSNKTCLYRLKSMIPNVYFDKKWTDEELFDLVGYTDEQIATVKRLIF